MKIPRNIHLIWVGPEIPLRVERRFFRWKRLNPDWRVWFWTDRAVSLFALPFVRKPSRFLRNFKLSKLAKTPAGASDILRYSIIERFGGAYFDCDFEPIRPIGDLMDNACRVFCRDRGGRSLPNGFFAEMAHGEVCGACCDALEAGIDLDQPPSITTGPVFFGKIAEPFLRSLETKMLPRKTLYPYGFGESEIDEKDCTENTIAIHRWEGSWRKDS